MPSRKIREGDPVVVRGEAVSVCSDAVQVRFQSTNGMITVTQWMPASECARPEDFGELKPLRRANPRHIER